MSESININQLFEEAQDEGMLSQQSVQALVVHDIGAQIQAGMGISVNDVESSEVILVTIMPDDSGSIRFGGNSKAICDGHNLVLDSLMDSKQQDNILVHNRYLNGNILYPYCALDQAIKMNDTNYNANQGTPLYDETIVLLGTVLAKTKEFSDNGVPVRTVTLIMTDGEDQHSVRAKADTIKIIVDDMLRAENHIIAAMGFDNNKVKFREIFREMGLLDQWILTPGNTQSDIRKAFQMFNQSVVRASQSAVNFSKAALGGFGG